MWDFEYNDTLNSSDTLNVTQFYYTVHTSNCGMCPTTTSFTSAKCNVTMSDLLAGTCNVTVITQVMQCGITTEITSEQYSVHLINDIHEVVTGTFAGTLHILHYMLIMLIDCH
jgi:hypothetical protein